MINDLIDLFEDASEAQTETKPKKKEDDEDWALWYADQLLKMKDFAPLLGGNPDKTALVHALLALNKNYLQDRSNESWEEYFAKHIVDMIKF